MEVFETLFIFVALIIVNSFVHAFIPKVLLASIQIFPGMILYFAPIPIEFDFDSELSMVTLIAPLLLVEGANISGVHLRKYIKPAIMITPDLVITTAISVGLFIHWIWPKLPMGAAFAAAVVLCPTDTAAVQAITKDKALPKGSMITLEGESLLNNAAGIISFKIIVGVLIIGAFSIFDAIQQLLAASIEGTIIGLIIDMALMRFRLTLVRRGIENTNMFIFI